MDKIIQAKAFIRNMPRLDAMTWLGALSSVAIEHNGEDRRILNGHIKTLKTVIYGGEVGNRAVIELVEFIKPMEVAEKE